MKRQQHFLWENRSSGDYLSRVTIRVCWDPHRCIKPIYFRPILYPNFSRQHSSFYVIVKNIYVILDYSNYVLHWENNSTKIGELRRIKFCQPVAGAFRVIDAPAADAASNRESFLRNESRRHGKLCLIRSDVKSWEVGAGIGMTQWKVRWKGCFRDKQWKGKNMNSLKGRSGRKKRSFPRRLEVQWGAAGTEPEKKSLALSGTRTFRVFEKRYVKRLVLYWIPEKLIFGIHEKPVRCRVRKKNFRL